MRILITGGLGFVGGRLASYLQSRGYDVVVGSRDVTAAPLWLPGVSVVRMLWEDSRALQKACNSVDVILHAAGMNSQDCSNDPVEALNFNGTATSRLVSAAISANVRQFIFLSTAHVYADPLVGRINEQTCPTSLHPYATSNLAGEQALQYALKQKEIGGCVLRLSNVFGAPIHKEVNCWTLVINDLCKQALSCQKMVLKGDGRECRDFVPMTKVCQTLEWLVSGGMAFQRETLFNLGSGRAQTVLDVAKTIKKRCTELFSFEPELQKSATRSSKVFEPLYYVADNLQTGDFQSFYDPINEIDNLLNFCHANFSG